MKSIPKFPLFTPEIKNVSNQHKELIVADVRREKSIFSIFECIDGNVASTQEATYTTEDFKSFEDMLKSFLEEKEIKTIKIISIAVPGPVVNGKCETDNLPWSLDIDAIKKELNLEKVYLLNDLEAIAYSIAELNDEKIEILHQSENKIDGNVAILSAATGLGEAGLYFDGQYLHPFATEGGRCEFSPRNDFEIGFYQFLHKIHGIVTWEHVLSKNGVYNIYRYLRDIGRHQEDAWLNEAIQNGDLIDVFVDTAKQRKSRLVHIAVVTFFEYLAREANSLVLKLKATGGLIITGEIPSKLYEVLDKDKFYKSFIISDRMQNILKDIPIYLLRNDRAVIEGAAYYGMFKDVD